MQPLVRAPQELPRWLLLENAVLMTALRKHLEVAEIELIEARQVPANDGGLALGQAWVARRSLLAGLPLSGENSADQPVTKEML